MELDDVLWRSIPVKKYLTYSIKNNEVLILAVGLAMDFSRLILAVGLAMTFSWFILAISLAMVALAF